MPTGNLVFPGDPDSTLWSECGGGVLQLHSHMHIAAPDINATGFAGNNNQFWFIYTPVFMEKCP